MSRQLENDREQARSRYNRKVCQAAEDGLAKAVARAGGELQGLSAKLSDGDCLLTIRANMPAGRMIAFVGSDTMASGLLKACNQASSDSLRWKPDSYAK